MALCTAGIEVGRGHRAKNFRRIKAAIKGDIQLKNLTIYIHKSLTCDVNKPLILQKSAEFLCSLNLGRLQLLLHDSALL